MAAAPRPEPVAQRYTNPVHDGYFADPFVLRVGEDYYAYGTADPGRGATVDVMHSTDLVRWQPLGAALEPLAGSVARDYWAPEVAAADGRFYLYFSAGVGDTGHHIRVAVADLPQGPFRDTGAPVTNRAEFAIDASPFRDEDGGWWLYYARDLLDGDRPGTTVAVDRLLDMTTVAGRPSTVVRASAEWQRYQADRTMYGDVYDWHTTEGPFVCQHDGRYWCFYSGGNWREASYGVSVAVADAPDGPWFDPPGDRPTVLRTVPGVVGPGHNSVVVGPDGTDWIVYHAWDRDGIARRMCIDRLEWTPAGPRCAGPTWTPQPAPGLRPR